MKQGLRALSLSSKPKETKERSLCKKGLWHEILRRNMNYPSEIVTQKMWLGQT